MAIFTNKHVVIAMCVAPILAIVSYIAVDKIVAEPPQAIQSGNAYPLRAKSNCRYASGKCTLENQDVLVTIESHWISDNEVQMQAYANHTIQNSYFALLQPSANQSTETEPQPLVLDTTKQNTWQITFKVANRSDVSKLRVILNIAGSHFYAETEASFFLKDA